MNFECPKCHSPIATEGQRFCNRCGQDLHAYYESRGITIPVPSGELNQSSPMLPPEEVQTLEMNSPIAHLDQERPVNNQTLVIEAPEITQASAQPDATSPQKALLRIVLPSSDVFDRELVKVETQIGKGPRNDIVIADPAVSTSHAVIRVENGGYTITDIGSRNGTSVNGKRIIATQSLNHGDVIGMGVTKLTFRFADYSETGMIQMPDITAAGQVAPLPLTEDSLAYTVVAEKLLSQADVDNLRGPAARGRRLYRALVEEKMVDEVKLRDLMSRIFHIPTIKLREAQVAEPLIAKFPVKLAHKSWVFPVAESAQQLTLAVADPTDTAATSEVKKKFNPKLEVRLATASEILEQFDRHYGPKLVGVLPDGEKIEHAINKHETEIGKAPHNHIILTDPTVSNTHAIILFRDGGYSIVDLGSRNGTFVNGERLSTHARTLKHGDTIQMGQTVWTFRNSAETPENVTAILSAEALEEVRKRTVPADSAQQTFDQEVKAPLANWNSVSSNPGQEANPAPPPAQSGASLTDSAPEPEADKDKKKKKKEKEKEAAEKQRIKAAYIRAIGGILATIMSAVLTVVLTITVMRSGGSNSGSNTNNGKLELSKKGHPKLKLSAPAAGTAFNGGKLEASGAVQVPNSDGIYIVDNGKSEEIFWMPLTQNGAQAGPIKPILFGAKVDDAESITYGGSFFYVMSSLSDPDAGDKNSLVRFALDPITQGVQGTPEVMTGIRDYLAANVPELKSAATLPYDQGGINIEGLAWDAVHDRLLLGFRSPVVNGSALLVPIKLRDPRGAFTTQNLITEPSIQIPLGGLGIRDIQYDSRAGAFLIIAGAQAQGDVKDFVLYEWTGDTDFSKPEAMPIELSKLDSKMKPEGVAHVKIGGKEFIVITGDASSFLKIDLQEGQ
jgi:pSer/pThr/pTyr-binding forkhead associated (FHA) protein